MRPPLAAALVLAALFAVVVALNATGTFHALDQRAVHDAMPGLEGLHASEPSLLDALKPFGGGGGPAERAAEAWLYPGSAPLAVLIVGACCLVLYRRGRVRAAVAWAAALAGGVAVEILVKHVVRRPALFDEGFHVVPFDDSLPSGHALRATILAAAVLYVWRRAGLPALVWGLTVPPLLVVAGWHTPSDVVAGLLLAFAAVAAVRASLAPR